MAVYSLSGCRFCGNSFSPRSSRQKHCAPECRFREVAALFFPSDTECWSWPGTIQKSGYGAMTWATVPKVVVKTAHRISYSLFVGPIPSGLFVLHSCDNRGCFNPAHLRIGTPQDNSTDMVKRNRHASADKQKLDKLLQKARQTKIERGGMNFGFAQTAAARRAIEMKRISSASSRAKDQALTERR